MTKKEDIPGYKILDDGKHFQRDGEIYGKAKPDNVIKKGKKVESSLSKL